MARFRSLKDAAQKHYEHLRKQCHACFSRFPFDAEEYISLCEQRRKAKLSLERIEDMYRTKELEAKCGNNVLPFRTKNNKKKIKVIREI